MSSPPKPRVRRERDRFEELERKSRGELKGNDRAPAVQMPPRQAPRHLRSDSASSSTGSCSASGSGAGSAGPSPAQTSPTRSSDRPSTGVTYPNYYDFSDHAEPLSTHQQQQQRNQQAARRAAAYMNMAMQVPIQPQHQPHAPQQRLVDHPGQNPPHTSTGPGLSSSSRPQSASGPSPQLATAQLAQTTRSGPQVINTNPSTNSSNSGHHRVPSGARERPPSYTGSQTGGMIQGPRSPTDEILPPNKVDLDAARYRQAQQQTRRERDRDRPQPPAKDGRERRPSQSAGAGRPPPGSLSLNTNPARNSMPNQHGRPMSPESLLTPTGGNMAIQRLPTPSIPNSVLQPLDAKVSEYGNLMSDAQSEMARLDEEMRALQERQRGAEQRFLEAKAKHDDYRRQYADVERALRGEYHHHRGDREVAFQDDDGRRAERDVPPMPSMPSLQQYGVGGTPGGSRSGSGNLLNNGIPGAAQGAQGMRSQRTVSVQSDGDSVNGYSRPGSKRGRWSRVFGIGA